MKKKYLNYICFIILLLTGCKSSIKEQSDKIYSRHLQRYVPLTIISTPMPDDKSDMNLLLFNDADQLEEIDAKKIIDSLFRKKLIQPLILVVIHGDVKNEYGISNLSSPVNTGSKADKYSSFIDNELYAFIKKKAVTRKFKSLAICGCSLAGTSAFDIAWDHADKIDKAGIFSPNLDYAGNAALEKINTSRKKPKLGYWFYAADNSDTITLNNTKTLIGIIEKKNTGNVAGIEFIAGKNENNDVVSWRRHFPEFLLWAFGK